MIYPLIIVIILHFCYYYFNCSFSSLIPTGGKTVLSLPPITAEFRAMQTSTMSRSISKYDAESGIIYSGICGPRSAVQGVIPYSPCVAEDDDHPPCPINAVTGILMKLKRLVEVLLITVMTVRRRINGGQTCDDSQTAVRRRTNM